MKVVEIAIREGKFLPTYDFENRHGVFVGHRGPARISEVANTYPQMIETDKQGKTYRYRFRFENSAEFMPLLSESWRVFIRQILKETGHTYKVYKQVPVFTESGVRFETILLEN